MALGRDFWTGRIASAKDLRLKELEKFNEKDSDNCGEQRSESIMRLGL